MDLTHIEEEFDRLDLDEEFDEWAQWALRHMLYSYAETESEKREMAVRLGDAEMLMEELDHVERTYRDLLSSVE